MQQANGGVCHLSTSHLIVMSSLVQISPRGRVLCKVLYSVCRDPYMLFYWEHVTRLMQMYINVYAHVIYIYTHTQTYASTHSLTHTLSLSYSLTQSLTQTHTHHIPNPIVKGQSISLWPVPYAESRPIFKQHRAGSRLVHLNELFSVMLLTIND